MRRGKTTVADYLVNKHNFIRISFAAKIKEIVAELRPDLVEGGKKPRIELQCIGEQFKTCLGNMVWVNYTLRQIRDIERQYLHLKDVEPRVELPNFVIDDMRFEYEAEALTKLGWLILKVDGPNRTGETIGQDHISEKAIDEIAAHDVIENDGTLEELYQKVDDTIRFTQQYVKRWGELNYGRRKL